MPSKATTTPTINQMYERLTATIDALLEGKLTPEHGNAIANNAEKVAQFAKLEIQAMDLALSNDRPAVGSGFMPSLATEYESTHAQLSSGRSKLLTRR